MKTSESIAVATVSLFEAVDCPFMVNRPAAPQIFASKPSNCLTLATARACTVLKLIYQKFEEATLKALFVLNKYEQILWICFVRRMDKFYSYAT